MDITKYLTQTCTYWAPLSRDKYGKTTFSAPVTRACRFKYINEQIVSGTGELINAKCEVWFIDIAVVGGYLYLGTSVIADPLTIEGAYEIKQYETIEFKSVVIFRRAWT